IVQFLQRHSCDVPTVDQASRFIGWCKCRSRSTPLPPRSCSHSSSMRRPGAPTNSGKTQELWPPSGSLFVYVTVYSPDWSGLKRSGAVTPGHGVMPIGQPTFQVSLPFAAFELKEPVPSLRWTSAKGVALIAWHTDMSLAKQPEVAWRPPTQAPQLPVSV